MTELAPLWIPMRAFLLPKYLKRYRGDKMKRQSALVVFSGGQDSTTCLFWELSRLIMVNVTVWKLK